MGGEAHVLRISTSECSGFELRQLQSFKDHQKQVGPVGSVGFAPKEWQEPGPKKQRHQNNQSQQPKAQSERNSEIETRNIMKYHEISTEYDGISMNCEVTGEVNREVFPAPNKRFPRSPVAVSLRVAQTL